MLTDENNMDSAKPRRTLAVASIVALTCLSFVPSTTVAATGESTPPWPYDLRPGDHLVYRYTFQKHSLSNDEEFQTEAHFRTHVLVLSENKQNSAVTLGFQRNRESAELTEDKLKGKDKLAHEQIDFQKRLQARPSHFSEAMEISLTGEPRYPWEIARETYSHLIDAMHEVMILPSTPIKIRESWGGNNLGGLAFRWVNDESIHGKLCHHVEGSTPDGALKLSYWWSPDSGILEQVTADGTYSNYGDKVHETAHMELESRARGEQLASWLTAEDLREGALQAILLNPEIAVSAEQLDSILKLNLADKDSAPQALALAIASRRKITLPSETLSTLQKSTSTRVRTQTEAYTNARIMQPREPEDECHRPLPPRPPSSAKFGTTFQVAPPGDGTPDVPYLLRLPLSYRDDHPSPLLIYLSGGPGLAIDGVNTAEDVVAGTDYVVLYPHAASFWWTPEIARRFDSAFNDVMHRYNIDRDRVYITGFSNGGTGALYFATLWPQRFAAVVTEMGAGECNEEVKAGLPNVKNLPILLLHGENDPIITPDCSTTTYETLKDSHPAIAPELKILPKHGHDITLQSDEGLTLPFFKDKVRNPFPREADMSLTDSLAPRNYWIEIVDGKPGKSDLAARVKLDNTIEIHTHDAKHIRLHLRPELMPKPGDIRIQWNGRNVFSGSLRDVCSLQTVAPGGDPKLDRTDVRDLTLP